MSNELQNKERNAGVNGELENRSTLAKTNIDENLARFFYMCFWGRTDVFAKRYENKNRGTSGYFPQCNNFWRYNICPKVNNKKARCSDCNFKSWKRLGAKEIIAHLKGDAEDCSDVIGVYPLFADGTCRFLVFDFDNHEKSMSSGDDDFSWKKEVDALRTICNHFNIPALVERSRSGNGAHVWILFKGPIEAYVARKFGSLLLDKGAEIIDLDNFRYYDRMLPAQDYIKDGGLGNLIALPLQGRAVKKLNSVFIDEKWHPYPNQWKYLQSASKLSSDFIEEFIKENSDIVNVSVNCDKPWERKNSFDVSDIDGEMIIVLYNGIYINKTNIKPRLRNEIRKLARFSNPAYYKNNAMGISNYKTSQFIYTGYDDSDYICIPRGLLETLCLKCSEAGIDYVIDDKRCNGLELDIKFNGTLKEIQRKASDIATKHETGIINAATAFGKTVVCMNIIARRKVNTLILLESSTLIEQWQNAIEKFIEINEDLPQYITPKGRIKTREKHVGIIHGAKDTSTGIIDIAMVGSLKKHGIYNERLKHYGMIIVDECHHSASNTLREVLMHINAKYVYGVTATPIRSDGLEKINEMVIGPIRFRYTAKEKAIEQGIDHIVIPRFTRVVNPHGSSISQINDEYRIIRLSDIRNKQIADDIKRCVLDKRTPVVLCRFKDQASIIFDEVHDYADKVFLLTGDLSKSEQKALRRELDNVSDEESLILISIGGLVGEGFDYPRLDTLILATPIASESVVEQYAGRLNRDYPGKDSVVIYDYIDSNIHHFDNMYYKRLKAYKKIGYRIKDENFEEIKELNTIVDCKNYKPIFYNDIGCAKKSIVISSPSLSSDICKDVLDTIKTSQERGVKVTVLTAQEELLQEGFENNCAVQLLKESGIEVVLQNEISLCYGIFDNSIVWYGNMDLLGVSKKESSMMRINSTEIAASLLMQSFGKTESEMQLCINLETL